MGFVKIIGTLTDGDTRTLTDCIDFSFTKDRYSATQIFKGKFVTDYIPNQFKAVTVSILNKTVLTGYVEKQEIIRDGAGYILNIHAKSYSSLLDSNHAQPGVYPRISFSSGFSLFSSGLTGVSCGSGSTVLSSITLPDWTTHYDALSHISVCSYDTYPYVTMGNEIRCSLPRVIPQYSITASDILDIRDNWDTSALISKIYMKDADGNYGAYSRTCPYTQSLGIVREKHIGLMKEWLFDIQKGLAFKLNMARRRCHTRSITYKSYMGEDIYSVMNFPNGYLGQFTDIQIHAIEIKGNDKKISTTLKYFDDYYCNMEK